VALNRPPRRAHRLRVLGGYERPTVPQCPTGRLRKWGIGLQNPILRPQGPPRTNVAVAANLLRVIYHMLKDGTCYKDLGEGYRRPRNPARAAANLANRIRALGYQVDIRRAA
jgi:hypothetical protein